MSTGAQTIASTGAAATTIRPATVEDADVLASVFYDAFASIAGSHNLPLEPGSAEFSRFMIGRKLATDGIVALVAERAGTPIGSAFVDERDAIAGIGPVSVDPAAQGGGVGRALMAAVLDREREREVAGIRLVQTAYNYRSLSLYAKLGFRVRETLSVVQGEPPALSVPGIGVREATAADLPACGALCTQVHGHDRNQELAEAIADGTARLAERPGRVCGYATGFGYGWHAVAETNEDLLALLGSAEALGGLGILVPSRNAGLLRWCLDHGLRIVQQSTLMTIGLYNEPDGSYLPSIAY